jgi:hypothetical protein
MELPEITENSTKEEIKAWLTAAEKWCNESMAKAIARDKAKKKAAKAKKA